MPLPATWKTVTVTATFTRADTAGPAAGSVQFTPVKAVGIAADVVLPALITATLNGSGQISVSLPCPNSAGVTSLVYEVIERVPGGRSYYIEVLASMTGSIALADFDPLTDDQAAYYSLRGPTGDVTPEALAAKDEAIAAAANAQSSAEAVAARLLSRDDFPSDTEFNAAKIGKISFDASKRLRAPYMIAGETEVSGAALRDSFIAARSLTGLTDCHAFTDRTQISGVTDYGGYCSFDTIVSLDGSNAQNHCHNYQARFEYKGSGSLTDHTGFYSRPVFSGNGAWENRYGVRVYDVDKTGTGTLTNNIGLYIDDLISGSANVGLNIRQTTGTSIYAPGGAKMYHKGNVGIGPQQNGHGVALTASGAATGPKAYLHSSTTAAYFGAVGGDFGIQFVANGGTRLEVLPSSGAYAVRPGSDNSQPLGEVSKRWKNVYAGNVELTPAASVTPSSNGSMSFELTSDTTLKIKVKGSDGIVRSATITLT